MSIYIYIYIYIYLHPAFENYHKIAVRDHVRVPKFWLT